jgi:CRISPR-associated protein Csb1
LREKTMSDLNAMLDAWADGAAAALVLEQPLRPVVGSIVFPPTFAPPPGREESDYIIDPVGDDFVVTLNTPGAEANHLEPIFGREKPLTYSGLIPQVWINVGKQRRKNLLDVGHRAGDALVRSSTASELITKAYQDVLDGDHGSLAEIAPTSIVFGSWDSRLTQAKLPRLIESRIDAYGVERRRRAAQYFPPIRYVEHGFLDDDAKQKKIRSEAGFVEAPSGIKPGGVEVSGKIVRTMTIALVGIASLGTSSTSRSVALRRYILGLALTAATAPIALNLRQGCLLVRAEEVAWRAVHHNGTEEPVVIDHERVFEYPQAAAQTFFGGAVPTPEPWTLAENGARNELKRYQDRKKKRQADEATTLSQS